MIRPSFQFYPGDWLRDPNLRMCSLAARGLWADMLCYMHQGTPYGYLKVGDKVILPDNLARMVGSTIDETTALLRELEDAGVFSRDEDGCIFSRRLIRDEEIRQSRAAGGSKGGNPALKKGATKQETLTTRLTSEDNQKPTPSSSSSSPSPSPITEIPPNPPKGNSEYSPEFEEFWSVYPRTRRMSKKEAFKKWSARLKDKGVTAERLLTAAANYADECRIKGKAEEHIMQPATFLGPSERWLPYEEAATQPAPLLAQTFGRNPPPKPAARPIDEFTDEDFEQGA